MTTTRRTFLAAAGTAILGWTRGVSADSAHSREVLPPLSDRIGVCGSVARADAVRKAGASYLEVSVRSVLVPDRPRDAFLPHLEAVRTSAVPVRAANGFLPGSLRCVGPDADPEGVLAYATTAFRRAHQAGIEVIVFGSSGARKIPDGFERERAEDQFVALLTKMAPIAGAHAVTVAVEPLNPDESNFIQTLPEGARLVKRVDHPRIGLTADLYHMARMEEPPSHLRDAIRFVRHVHVAEKKKRTPPGVEGDLFAPYLRPLVAAGYAGRISLECRWNDFDEQVAPAVAALRAQVRSVR